ncbi:MAG: hypothetical protein JRJ82_20575, partial [Deltaproteobacteria bacterium]|nr:hypothetical protein [Deltaproteobacteria bacterium]
HNEVYADHEGGPSAFEEAGIHVHDVTGMPSFAGPEEPPNIDILVVTNKTERDTVDGLIHTLLGKENGTINHPSVTKIRYWEWDTKGTSFIGDAQLYAVLRDAALNPLRQATETYHLCLMHYIHNRPYIDELGVGPCDTKNTYVGKLDPLNKVEDWYLENGANPPDSQGNKKEDRCITGVVPPVLDGDRMDPDWKTAELYGDHEWHRGHALSVFDANNNGLVENPRVDDPQLITKEYTPEMLQLHTVIHEMGHGVGCDKQHTADLTCVMYQDSPDWDRAGHFCPYALSQMYIHNKTEY